MLVLWEMAEGFLRSTNSKVEMFLLFGVSNENIALQ